MGNWQRITSVALIGLLAGTFFGCASGPVSTPQGASAEKPEVSEPKASEEKAPTQRDFLKQIWETASEGQVVDCPLVAGKSVLEDAQKLWGTPNKQEWVSDAKGLYSDYNRQGIVLGSNKGDAIFEVRTFDDSLKSITRGTVEQVYGTPEYQADLPGEKVLGYVLSEKYKLLLVFKVAEKPEASVLDHYSVFYPKGTVNNMADDPGRNW